MQRAANFTARDFGVGALRLFARKIGGDSDKGIEFGIVLRDALEKIVGEFERGNFARGERVAGGGEGEGDGIL